jgi:hypothetical protein
VLLYVLERERKRDSFLSSLSERERERERGGVRYLERGGGGNQYGWLFWAAEVFKKKG